MSAIFLETRSANSSAFPGSSFVASGASWSCASSAPPVVDGDGPTGTSKNPAVSVSNSPLRPRPSDTGMIWLTAYGEAKISSIHS